MSERTPENIRIEIAAERQALHDDLSALQSDLRSLAVFVAAGLVVVGLVTWRTGKRKGARDRLEAREVVHLARARASSPSWPEARFRRAELSPGPRCEDIEPECAGQKARRELSAHAVSGFI